MARTKEEKLLLKIFEVAKMQANFDLPINVYEIGRSLGQREKSLKTTIQILAQANFIKKIDDENVIITENGKNLAQSLLK